MSCASQCRWFCDSWTSASVTRYGFRESSVLRNGKSQRASKIALSIKCHSGPQNLSSDVSEGLKLVRLCVIYNDLGPNKMRLKSQISLTLHRHVDTDAHMTS